MTLKSRILTRAKCNRWFTQYKNQNRLGEAVLKDLSYLSYLPEFIIPIHWTDYNTVGGVKKHIWFDKCSFTFEFIHKEFTVLKKSLLPCCNSLTHIECISSLVFARYNWKCGDGKRKHCSGRVHICLWWDACGLLDQSFRDTALICVSSATFNRL